MITSPAAHAPKTAQRERTALPLPRRPMALFALVLLVMWRASQGATSSRGPEPNSIASLDYGDLSYWEELVADGTGEGLASSQATFARSTPDGDATAAVAATFSCRFSIWASSGYYDFTYEARIFDPSNQQIAYATRYALSKPSFTSDLGVTVSDPAAGTYLCTINWWVNSFEVPQRQATATISYRVPSGETTLHNAWSGLFPTAYKWRGRLVGGSFGGRKVREQDGGQDVDTCYFQGSNYPPATGLTIDEPWDVDANGEYGDDVVGWLPWVVTYYRAQGRAPCQSETSQVMEINRPGASWVSYTTNRLKMGFTAHTVWSERAGQVASKNY